MLTKPWILDQMTKLGKGSGASSTWQWWQDNPRTQRGPKKKGATACEAWLIPAEPQRYRAGNRGCGAPTPFRAFSVGEGISARWSWRHSLVTGWSSWMREAEETLITWPRKQGAQDGDQGHGGGDLRLAQPGPTGSGRHESQHAHVATAKVWGI